MTSTGAIHSRWLSCLHKLSRYVVFVTVLIYVDTHKKVTARICYMCTNKSENRKNITTPLLKAKVTLSFITTFLFTKTIFT